MSGCVTKSKWLHYSEAKREARRLSGKHGIEFKTYYCSIHVAWHTAKKYQTPEYSQYVANAKRSSEKLVGQMIGVLRKVLDKERS